MIGLRSTISQRIACVKIALMMFLIFALQRTNVLPTGDLGVRAAIKKVYGLEDLPKPGEIEELARGWHPYCTVATWYLWRSLDGKGGI